jgi:hypothetical protein
MAIVATQLNQVERIQEPRVVKAPVADAIEGGDPAIVAGDGLPVDYARVGS